MTYQVLARKWRPKSFASLVGQEHVVRALTHALDGGRLHHAYLFTGTRGVGKTTLSRIFAKALNCETGVTSTPCGVCRACKEIDEGRFVDYVEMDAASNRGVDEMAALLERAVYAPVDARFKVYMIDEVHMLTNHAFNAMLKTLEEPPAHVKFILATTDPQKIPVTVLSRCLQFNLKQMPAGQIVGHLEYVLGQEGIAFEQPALRLLAQGAHGSMRDALSLTDQAIAYAAGEVTLDAVQGMLGALDQSYLIRLLDALAAQDGADLLAVADEMATRSLSYNGALQDLGTLLHRIALAQTVPAAVPSDLPEYADIVRLAAAFDAEEVQPYYQIAVHGRNELGLAPDEYAGFSMTLLRMLAFRPGVGGADGVPPAAPVAARPAGAAAAAAAAARASSPPARAAAHSVASHAAVLPPAAVVAGAAAALARSEAAASPSPFAASAAASAPASAAGQTPTPARAPMAMPAPAPAPYVAEAANHVAPASAAPAAVSQAPISSARAAINAALEAARAASKPGARSASSSSAPAAGPAVSAAAPEVSAATSMAPAAAASAPAAPRAVPPSASMAGSASGVSPQAAPQSYSSRGPAPWEDSPPPMSAADVPAAAQDAQPAQTMPQLMSTATHQAAAPAAMPPAPAIPPQAAARAPVRQAEPEDDLPPWVTEFSDDSAVAHSVAMDAMDAMPASSSTSAPAAASARPAPAPARAPHAYVITPVPELDWDGNWPAVAAALPLRGVAQQLAMQAELIDCVFDGNAAVFKLRVPIETWRTPGNVEKLTAALAERFGRAVRVETELGPAWYTASAEAQAHRAACQLAAEQTVANDPFVNDMIREFGAFVVPGSIVPPAASVAA